MRDYDDREKAIILLVIWGISMDVANAGRVELTDMRSSETDINHCSRYRSSPTAVFQVGVQVFGTLYHKEQTSHSDHAPETSVNNSPIRIDTLALVVKTRSHGSRKEDTTYATSPLHRLAHLEPTRNYYAQRANEVCFT